MVKSNEIKLTLLVAACLFAMLPATADEASEPAAAPAEQTPAVIDTVPRHMTGAQEVVGKGEQLFIKANEYFVDGRFDEARDLYIKAKQAFVQYQSEDYQKKTAACDECIKQCYIEKAEAAMKVAESKLTEQDFDTAIKEYQEVKKYCPEYAAKADKMIALCEKRKAAAAYRASVGRDALLPEQTSQEYQIQVLLRQGKELARVGDLTQAERKYKDILMIDPYNADALHNLRSINKRSIKIADVRYKDTHKKMMAELEWTWANQLSVENAEAAAENAIDAPVAKDAEEAGDLNAKLRSIILPRVDFDEITIPAALKYLQAESKRNDPERIGVNLFLRRPPVLGAEDAATQTDPMMMPMGGSIMMDPMLAAANGMMNPAAMQTEAGMEEGEEGAEQEEKMVSMSITKMSLYDVLQMLCKEMKLKMRVERYAVVLAPENVALDELQTKIFPLEKSVFSDFDPEADPARLKLFFRDYGVSFPTGAKIVYDGHISRLIVTNTLDNLQQIDNVIAELQSESEPLVEISAKFIEVSQNDLKELGFDYTVSYNPGVEVNAENGYGSHRLSFDDSVQGLLRSYGTVNGTGTNDQLVTLGGYMGGSDGFNYTVAVNALNQMDSNDALASPRITTLPDMKASIKMIREVPFADDYDDGEWDTSNTSDNQYTNVSTWTYISPFPDVNLDDAEQLGIVLDVIPSVDKEQRTITLQMAPRVSSFVEWMNYSTTDPSGNVEFMRKPIIALRQIDTTVTVRDGETLVLGGVVEDTTEVLNDKIPILGDIPLIGRLFQSRYTSGKKRNLLIFMTCKLVKPDGTPFFPAERIERGIPRIGRYE